MDRIQFRRDTLDNWNRVNPILLEGEIGYVLDDPNLHKMGDGVHTWNQLPFRGFDGTIVHETGDNENAVMSQKATTDKLTELEQKIISFYGTIYNLTTRNRGSAFGNIQDAINQLWENVTVYESIKVTGLMISFATGFLNGDYTNWQIWQYRSIKSTEEDVKNPDNWKKVFDGSTSLYERMVSAESGISEVKGIANTNTLNITKEANRAQAKEEELENRIIGYKSDNLSYDWSETSGWKSIGTVIPKGAILHYVDGTANRCKLMSTDGSTQYPEGSAWLNLQTGEYQVPGDVALIYSADKFNLQMYWYIPSINGEIEDLKQKKQDKLTIDSSVVQGSSNPVTSNAVYQFVTEKENSINEKINIDDITNVEIAKTTIDRYINNTTHSYSALAGCNVAVFQVEVGKKYNLHIPLTGNGLQVSCVFTESKDTTTNIPSSTRVGNSDEQAFYDIEATTEWLQCTYIRSAGAPTLTTISKKEIKNVVLENTELIENNKESIENHEVRIEELEKGYDVRRKSIYLPKAFHLVEGDTFQIFWKCVILAANYLSYNIKVDCTKGSNLTRMYSWQSPTIGNYPMTVSIYNDHGNLVDSASTTLCVHPKTTNPITNKNILCVGASDLVNGIWATEAYRRLTDNKEGFTIGAGTGIFNSIVYPKGDAHTNISFIGNMQASIKDKDGVTRVTGGFEGNGGWSWDTYNVNATNINFMDINVASHDKTDADQHSFYRDANGTEWKLETIYSATKLKMIRVTANDKPLPSSGTLTWVSGGFNQSNIVYTSSSMAAGNPFWDDTTSKISFAKYAQKLGVTGIDICYVQLGGNSHNKSYEYVKEQCKIFINNILADFPNCKIVLMAPYLPSYDGCGQDYGCDWYMREKTQWFMGLCNLYDEIAEEYPSNVYAISIAAQFDIDYGMQMAGNSVAVYYNSRTDARDQYRQMNGLHPATRGYVQIADAVYRDLNYRLQM